jgi:hypothetical protein
MAIITRLEPHWWPEFRLYFLERLSNPVSINRAPASTETTLKRASRKALLRPCRFRGVPIPVLHVCV